MSWEASGHRRRGLLYLDEGDPDCAQHRRDFDLRIGIGWCKRMGWRLGSNWLCAPARAHRSAWFTAAHRSWEASLRSFCHGQRPVISTSREKLSNVRISTIPASTATLRGVGVIATVRMMSAATRNSRPSRIERPLLAKVAIGGARLSPNLRNYAGGGDQGAPVQPQPHRSRRWSCRRSRSRRRSSTTTNSRNDAVGPAAEDPSQLTHRDRTGTVIGFPILER